MTTAPIAPTAPTADLVAIPNTAICRHRMWSDPAGLQCSRPAGHQGGHTYQDSHGSDVDDHHLEGGHG